MDDLLTRFINEVKPEMAANKENYYGPYVGKWLQQKQNRIVYFCSELAQEQNGVYYVTTDFTDPQGKEEKDVQFYTNRIIGRMRTFLEENAEQLIEVKFIYRGRDGTPGYLTDRTEKRVIKSPIKELLNAPVKNLIISGAPGTGKSHLVSSNIVPYLTGKKNNAGNDFVTRTVFTPSMMYEDFWGCYKPVKKNDGKTTYDFSAGLFANTLVKALRDPGHIYVLVIEEINRANVYDVFGLLFQLLDRKDGKGQDITLTVPTDALGWFKDELSPAYTKLTLPDNLYIIATMNPADQGVHTLDTAFLRRFSMAFIDIDGKLWTSSQAPVDFKALEKDEFEYFNGYDHSTEEMPDVRKKIRDQINSVLREEGYTDDKLISAHFVRDSATEMEFLINIASYLLTIYKDPKGDTESREKIFAKDRVSQWRLFDILNEYKKAKTLTALFNLTDASNS